MKLTLDHTQRLNLHALLGAQRADVGSIRAIWAVQDKLALDADEEKAVDLKRELVSGQERTVWNPSLRIAGRDFEFTDAELARVKAAIEMWDGYGVNADRQWLEPVIKVLWGAPCNQKGFCRTEESQSCPPTPQTVAPDRCRE
jgi:hypothetical protein